MTHEKPTNGMSREEWLEERRHSIGGSDAASIVGLNEYRGAFAVWKEKRGEEPPEEENEAMRLGTDLEKYVAERFTEETGKKVRRKNAILYNDQYPFAHANIDREIVGEDAILECKTASRLALKKYPKGEYPARYYVQCMHYLAVTGARRAYLAILVFQQGIQIYTIERDEEEINALMKAEAEFWRHVEDGTQPEAGRADGDALKSAYPEGNGQRTNLYGYGEIISRYDQLKQRAAELDGEIEELENRIKEGMGFFEIGDADGYTVYWPTRTRKTFDRKAYEKANPGALAPWTKETKYRVFEIRRNGGGTL